MKHAFIFAALLAARCAAAQDAGYVRAETWWDTVRASRAALAAQPGKATAAAWRALWEQLARDFPESTAQGLSASLETATGFPDLRGALEFHVATNGSDSATGTAAAPFATVQRARDAIRAQHPPHPVTVVVHGGTYFLAEPLQLGVEDSGSAAAPIVYRAAAGERVILSGGAPLTGTWQPFRDGIFQLDLPAQSAPWRFRQLFVNGQRATLARYPNADASDICRKGWLHMEGSREAGLLAGLGTPGDWVEYAFELPKAGAYALWIGLATLYEHPETLLALEIDGRPVPLAPLRKSGNWREVAFAKAAVTTLSVGRHTMRWTRTNQPARECRIHLDAFCFSDNTAAPTGTGLLPAQAAGETRILVEAEAAAARIGGQSKAGFEQIALHEVTKGLSSQRLACAPGTIKDAWLHAPQAEVFTFATWGWFNTVTWLDHAQRDEIRTNSHGRLERSDGLWLRGAEARSPLWPGNRFYLFNLLCELDEPGEWFLDYATQRLYYWPRPGEQLANAEIIAPRLARLIELVAPSAGTGRVEHVAFRGFTFSGTDYTPDQPDTRTTEDCAVLLENAWHCAIEDCTFTNIGGYAIRLSLDSCLNRIAGNTVGGAGAGGIMLRGPFVGWGRTLLTPDPAAATFYPLGNLLAGNRIARCGVFKKYVAGIHADTRPDELACAPGNVIAHNLIRHMPRNGIFGFRNTGGTVIEFNHIHDVLAESDDGGLVHICSSALNGTAPTLIRNNLLHDVRAYRQDNDWYGRTGLAARAIGVGVYLDNDTSCVTIKNNVIAGTSRGGVYLHNGEHNTVRNNILLGDRSQQFWQTKTWRGNRFEHNIVCWTNAAPDYACVAIATTKVPTAAEAAGFDRNLIWHGGSTFTIAGQGTWAQWQARGFDAHSLVADPRFAAVDLLQRICRLSADSPAFALGFQPIDLRRVGPMAKP
jgi:parallel beta-helix repeat protein